MMIGAGFFRLAQVSGGIKNANNLLYCGVESNPIDLIFSEQ